MSLLRKLVASSGAHLSDDVLSRHVSGEVESRELDGIQKHLAKCWKCRSRHDELDRAAMKFVELHKQLGAPNPPEAPKWRETFLARLDQSALELAPSPWWSRFGHQFGAQWSANMNPVLASAAVLLVASVVLFFIWQRSLPSVSASELLQRAESSDSTAAHADGPGVVYQKIRMKTPRGFLERDLYRDRAGRRKAKADAVPADLMVLSAKLQIAGVDWAQPLSASDYKSWHDRQEADSDEVKRSGKNLLTLTTKGSGGIVMQETLTVREEDFHPVERTVELLDVGNVEIAEVNYAVLGWDAVNEDLFEPLTPTIAPASSLHAVMAPASRVPPTATQLLDTELQARVALHTVGADLGEQVEVVHESHASVVLVQGLVNTPERKRELSAALQGIPDLDVTLQTVDEAVAKQESEDLVPPSREPVVTGHPALEDKLAQRFPNSDERAAFVNRTLSLADLAIAHAWALRRLEERYTVSQMALLNQSGRQTLELLVRDHVATIGEEIGKEQELFRPFLDSIQTEHDSSGKSLGREDWRGSVQEVFESVEKVQEDVRRLLVDPSDTPEVPETLSRDLQFGITTTKAQLSVLTDQVSSPFLSIPAIGAVPGQDESKKSQQEKP